MTVPLVGQAVAALAFVVGAIVLLGHAARRWARRIVPDSSHRIEVLGRVALGPKQGVATVRVADRVALVTWGDGGIRLLLELDGSPASHAPGAGSERAPSADRTSGNALRALMVGALAVGLAVGSTTGLTGQTSGPATGPAEAVSSAPSSGPADSAAAAPEGSSAAATRALERLVPRVDLQLGGADRDGLRLSGPVGAVLLMGALTLLPTLLLLMTSFTRILIVLHLLKQALGTQTAPPAHLLSAMALLLTGFVMAPTLSEVNRDALTPWMEGRTDELTMLHAAVVPFRSFMLESTRQDDLEQFITMSADTRPTSTDQIPTVVLTSAFVVSELTTAFQMGFALFLPFLVIDLVVASVLMSMGMFMLPPMMVSLPFKLLLFVMVDGWSLVISSLVSSF